jgi:heme-degrading monooxygenase HmoA
MFVVLADEMLQPGRRPELEAAHRETTATLAKQPGFVSGRLLHFTGGPYRYIHETMWNSREDFERFWGGPEYAGYRATIESWLSAPFVVQCYDVKVEA